MNIEEMIEKGCTFQDAEDKLLEIWEAAVAKKTKNDEIAKARKTVCEAYKNYISLLVPGSSVAITDLERILASCEEQFLSLAEKTKEPIKTTKNRSSESTKFNSLEDFIKTLGW